MKTLVWKLSFVFAFAISTLTSCAVEENSTSTAMNQALLEPTEVDSSDYAYSAIEGDPLRSPTCPADADNNGQVTPSDIALVVSQFNAGNILADIDHNGRVEPADIAMFINLFYAAPSNPACQGGAQSQGWTDLTPAAGARVIYVSTSGNNSNTGLDPAHPVQTLSRAYQLMRTGQPDQMLLKKGDTFTESLSLGRNIQGASATNRAVIASYGTGPRPKVRGSFDRGSSSNSQGNLVISGIEFSAPSLGDDHGINWQGGPDMQPGGGVNITIEDCYIHGFAQNLAIQGVTNLSVRRNVIADATSYSSDQPVKVGLYIGLSRDLLIEENVFDRNGWPVPGWYHHNVYIQSDTQGSKVFKRNIVVGGASHGIQMRAVGSVENNLFVRNGIAILFGTDDDVPDGTGNVTGNVILEGTDTDSNNLRGVGITLKNIASSVCENNIIARKIALGEGGGFEFQASVRNTTVRNNIDYQWSPITILNGNNPTFVGNSWQVSMTFPNPTRSLASYAASLNIGNTHDAMMAALRSRSRDNYPAAYTIDALLSYFRAGFGR